MNRFKSPESHLLPPSQERSLKEPDSLTSTLSPHSILLAISGTMGEALLDLLPKKRDANAFDNGLAAEFATMVDRLSTFVANLRQT